MVHEAVDIDFIRRQAELGAYDWNACKRLVGAVVSIIRRVQAPSRDAETQGKWLQVRDGMLAATTDDDQAHALCKVLEFMLDHINSMRVDAANARSVSPLFP